MTITNFSETKEQGRNKGSKIWGVGEEVRVLKVSFANNIKLFNGFKILLFRPKYFGSILSVQL